MKDTHNIILILVSSKWSIPSFGVCSWWINSLLFLFHLFLFRSSKISQLYHFKASSNHCKASILFLSSFTSFWSSFCYRSSSWRFYMMVHQGFNSFLNCSSRFFSEELKFSSSCNPEYNCSPLSFEVVIYHSSFKRMRYLKSINLFIGVILD